METERTIIFGRARPGLRVSRSFTEIGWVKEQFRSKLKMDPYPGTFNIQIEDNDYLRLIDDIKKRKGIEIVPGDPSFCSATCIEVLVEGKIKGAMIIPQVEDYPVSKIEIIASCNIRDALSIVDGDLVQLEFMFASKGSTSADKERQIQYCLGNDVALSKGTGFEIMDLIHNPLPEMDLQDVDISTSLPWEKYQSAFDLLPHDRRGSDIEED